MELVLVLGLIVLAGLAVAAIAIFFYSPVLRARNADIMIEQPLVEGRMRSYSVRRGL